MAAVGPKEQSKCIWTVMVGIEAPGLKLDHLNTAEVSNDIEWIRGWDVAPGIVSVVAQTTAGYGKRNVNNTKPRVAQGAARATEAVEGGEGGCCINDLSYATVTFKCCCT